jgi:hypothetical protein
MVGGAERKVFREDRLIAGTCPFFWPWIRENNEGLAAIDHRDQALRRHFVALMAGHLWVLGRNSSDKDLPIKLETLRSLLSIDKKLVGR